MASHADVLRGSSRVPAPLTSAEPKDKFLSHCSQISAGDHMQIIGDPIGAVEIKVLTSQTHIRTSYVECDMWPKIFAPDENLGDKPGAPNDSVLLNTLKTISVNFLYISLCKGWIRCYLLIKFTLSFFIPLDEKKNAPCKYVTNL